MLTNPGANIIKSKGIDRPFLYVYLAGRIAGECIETCLAWRHHIINFYRNYKGKGAYPIIFLDALNSKESDSVDAKGLTSAIPPNMIYDKDLLSVETADVVVANMDDFFDVDILDILEMSADYLYACTKDELVNIIFKLIHKIKNRRENLGTICEVAWALYLKKPLILIVPKTREEIFQKHPFMRRASAIVTSTEDLFDKKWLNILYKSIAGAIY